MRQTTTLDMNHTGHNGVIESLLDTDAYKLHMQQAIFHQYPNVEAVAEFHCRSKEDLRPYCQQIKAEIEKSQNFHLLTMNWPIYQHYYFSKQTTLLT